MAGQQPPSELVNIASYLKASDLRQRPGILKGKRVDFFKGNNCLLTFYIYWYSFWRVLGKHAVNCLLRPGYQTSALAKKVPVPDRPTAEAIVRDLHTFGFFLKAEKNEKSRFLKLVPEQIFTPEGYYFWVYQGSQWKGYLIGLGVVLVVLAGVMFPLWPALPRQGVYYLSLALLGFIGCIMGLGVLRAIIWLCLKLLIGRGGWLFPNLFADVGFIESFIPFWT
jgi:translocation protein SEC62